MDRPRICVLSGGTTAEARASRTSGAALYATLASCGYDTLWMDLTESLAWEVRSRGDYAQPVETGPHASSWREGLVPLLEASEVDLAFPILHGPIGEDGQLQALFEELSLPYIGCDPRASMSCFDKVRFKRVVRAAGLPVTESFSISRTHFERDAAAAKAAAERLAYPCIVKPSRSGSSLGLARVRDFEELDSAIVHALEFDDVVLIERLFNGVDVEIGVLGAESPLVGSPVELEYDGVLYDFETKYSGSRDVRHLPARVSSGLRGRIASTARQAYLAAGCRDMARVDLLVDPQTEQFVLNEINTLPYMPASSTFATSLSHATGQSYADILQSLVETAWNRRLQPCSRSLRSDRRRGRCLQASRKAAAS